MTRLAPSHLTAEGFAHRSPAGNHLGCFPNCDRAEVGQEIRRHLHANLPAAKSPKKNASPATLVR